MTWQSNLRYRVSRKDWLRVAFGGKRPLFIFLTNWSKLKSLVLNVSIDKIKCFPGEAHRKASQCVATWLERFICAFSQLLAEINYKIIGENFQFFVWLPYCFFPLCVVCCLGENTLVLLVSEFFWATEVLPINEVYAINPMIFLFCKVFNWLFGIRFPHIICDFIEAFDLCIVHLWRGFWSPRV